jgi:hypothetical protein
MLGKQPGCRADDIAAAASYFKTPVLMMTMLNGRIRKKGSVIQCPQPHRRKQLLM